MKPQNPSKQSSFSTALSPEWLDDIREAVRVMRSGGLVLMPTDTIWGLACDATNEAAVRKVFALKRRDDSKALIALVDAPETVQRYVSEVPDAAWDLMDVAMSPLTLVYDEARNLASNLVAADGSVAIRVTREPFSQALCKRMGRAVVSTSANISGEPSPRCFAEISEDVKAAVDYICTSRRDEKPAAKPSGIIKIGQGGEVKIIR
ncbi:MAG: threonylcarbamoyl-AMP synthase [Bacteroidaceae bacterium]|nr:threonylcarbamoyl-AMP synthase [Bacteroidaceae bacterium]